MIVGTQLSMAETALAAGERIARRPPQTPEGYWLEYRWTITFGGIVDPLDPKRAVVTAYLRPTPGDEDRPTSWVTWSVFANNAGIPLEGEYGAAEHAEPLGRSREDAVAWARGAIATHVRR